MIVLGIETSCDETSVSIVKNNKDRGKILSEKILSQVKKHQPFGGVVPELASRSHLEKIQIMTNELFSRKNIDPNEIIDLLTIAWENSKDEVMMTKIRPFEKDVKEKWNDSE